MAALVASMRISSWRSRDAQEEGGEETPIPSQANPVPPMPGPPRACPAVSGVPSRADLGTVFWASTPLAYFAKISTCLKSLASLCLRAVGA